MVNKKFEEAYSDVEENLKLALKAAGIEMPGKKQNIWIEVISPLQIEDINEQEIRFNVEKELFEKESPQKEDLLYLFIAPELLCQGEWEIITVNEDDDKIVLQAKLNGKFQSAISLGTYISNSAVSSELKSTLEKQLKAINDKEE